MSLPSSPAKGLVWLRRDLRLHDHRPLEEATRFQGQVQHLFVFDTTILNTLPTRDRRVEFIHDSLMELEAELKQYGGTLVVLHGDPVVVVPQFCQQHGITTVYAGRDFEPAAVARDDAVVQQLAQLGIQWHGVEDHTVVPVDAVVQAKQQPYVVFTPYFRKWLSLLDPFLLDASVDLNTVQWMAIPGAVPTLAAIGFASAGNQANGLRGGTAGAYVFWKDFLGRVERYHEARDFPMVKGTSYLSVHFRFGTLSARACVRALRHRMTNEGVLTWVKELAWRDFYAQLLHHFPHTSTSAFQVRYDKLVWNNAPTLLAAWKAGQTGYPLVDAAQRQLLMTGFMHNRLRMVTASFFTKHLGLDWRLGEAFFAEHLNDYDMASNVGGWQWAASTGSDAQPYFRVFNPTLQSEKFDHEGRFIRRYCPELNNVPATLIHAPWCMTAQEQLEYSCVIGQHYPAPVVDHRTARDEAIARFKQV